MYRSTIPAPSSPFFFPAIMPLDMLLCFSVTVKDDLSVMNPIYFVSYGDTE